MRIGLRPSRRAATALVLAGVLVLQACGSDDDATPTTTVAPATTAPGSTAPGTTVPGAPSTTEVPGTTTGPDKQPVRGGSATMIVQTEIPGASWDPLVLSHGAVAGTAARGLALYGALILLDSETGEPQPYMAESVKSEDGLTWVLKIRKGIEFSDGTPYDAAAVKFNWERMQNPDNKAVARSQAQEIESMEVTDDLTLTVKLKVRNANWPGTVAIRLPFIASPTAIQKEGAAFGEKPVGAGPFMLDQWLRDDRTIMKRNPSFFREGMPYLDELVFRIIPDEAQRFNTMSSGDADVLTTQNEPLGKQAEDDGDFNVNTLTLSGGEILIFNTTKAPFDDVRVRRALAMVNDLDRLNDGAREGLGVTSVTEFLPSSPNYDPAAAAPKPDLAAAQKLIDEVRAEKGDITFTIMGNNERQPFAEVYKQVFEQLDGVKVNIEIIAGSEVFPRMIAGNFEAGMSIWQYVNPDPVLFGALQPDGALNLGKYKSPELTAVLEEARAAVDPDDAVAAWKEVATILNTDVPWVRSVRVQMITILDPAIQGYRTHAEGAALFDEVWRED